MSTLDVNVPAGSYIVAVSGGVDSIVLLDLLSKQKNLSLTVAHFDHGIRSNSHEDAKFVENLSQHYGYPFELGKASLGKRASEDEARKARYDFLKGLKNNKNANSLITAHHQDDEIETALINILRGTSSKGLTPMRNSKTILRPLLGIEKSQILDYAKENNLEWREDSTNLDTSYLRNRIRSAVMPKINLSPKLRRKIMKILNQSHKSTVELNQLTELTFKNMANENKLRRDQFIALPHKVASELMAWWLKNAGVSGVDKKKINNLVVAAKTARVGSRHPISGKTTMIVNKEYLQLAS